MPRGLSSWSVLLSSSSPLPELKRSRTPGFHGFVRIGQKRYAKQDAQKGRPARPQRARRRGVPFAVRRVSERCENKAGGLFQRPASSVRSISNATAGSEICQRSRTSGCNSPITPTCFPSEIMLPTRPARNEGCWIGSRL